MYRKNTIVNNDQNDLCELKGEKMKKLKSNKKLVFGTAIIATFALTLGGLAIFKFNDARAGKTFVNGTILQGFEWNYDDTKGRLGYNGKIYAIEVAIIDI